MFRVSRVTSAVADEAPVRRRDGVELAELWQALRRQVEERPAEVAAVAATVVARYAGPAHERRATRNVPGTVRS